MMGRIRDIRVGVRLTLAFGLLTLLLVAVVGVGVWGATALRHDQDEIVNEIGTELPDLAQMKFYTAAYYGSEVAYGLDVVRGVPGAADDDVGARKAFLDNVQGYLAAHDDLEPHLAGGEIALEETLRTNFTQYMNNDHDIVALYRTGSPAEVALATSRMADEQAPLFQKMTVTIQSLADGVQGETVGLQQEATDAASASRNVMLALGAASVALAIGLAVLITRSLTRPLHESVDVLEAMAAGDLRVRVAHPSRDELGQMGTAMNHSLDRVSEAVDRIADGSVSLSSSSGALSAVSEQLSTAAEETAAQAASVSAAAEQVSHNVQSVAAGAEELGTSINEIAKNTNDAARVAIEAASVATATEDTVIRLGTSSAEIGEVSRLITSIAEQTNLLALNATIEAARAGDAGRGFAVVANEVKELARKTARSSDDIARKVESIQGDAGHAVVAISRISAIVREINDIQTVIAAAVDEQAATTREIGRSVTEAAGGSREIARGITDVAETARGVTIGASQTHRAAEDLSGLAANLLGLVGRFEVRPSEPPAAPAPSPREHEADGAVVHQQGKPVLTGSRPRS